MSAERSLGPTPADKRIRLLDYLRGIAVCGILPVNIIVMGTVGGTEGRTFPARLDADWISWSIQRLFLEGAMRGLFTLLFGAGMLMMLRRTEGDTPQVAPIDIWTRRCLALLLFGVIHFALLLWPGEILWTYGVAGFALLAFRSARPATLWIAALIILASLSAFRAYDTGTWVARYQLAATAELAQQQGQTLTQEQKTALETAQEVKNSVYPGEAARRAEIDQRTHLGPLLSWSAAGWASRHLGNYSWLGVAESLSFMLIGMALFRSGVLTGNCSFRKYMKMAAIGISFGLALRTLDFLWQARTGFELDIHRLNLSVSLLRSASYEPARLALTLGYIGLIALLFRQRAPARSGFLEALGRMALTAYTLQSLLTSALFYGFGTFGTFDYAALAAISAAIWFVSGTFCLWWLRHFSIGPAEWLLRAIAYGRLPRLRAPVSAPLL